VIALHNLGMARPVVIEFPQAVAGQGPEQDELVATAFGVGARWRPFPPVARSGRADWPCDAANAVSTR